MKEGRDMAEVHVLVIDLAKRSFRVCGTDRGGACVDAPGLARRFFDGCPRTRNSIGRVSGLLKWLISHGPGCSSKKGSFAGGGEILRSHEQFRLPDAVKLPRLAGWVN